MSGNGIKYFVASRVLRIYPALIVCVMLSVFLLGPLLTVSDGYWQSMETWRYLVGNATTYRTEYFLPGVFAGLHDPAINGSLWSLHVEVNAYLIVGLYFLAGGFSSKKISNALFFLVLITGYLTPEAHLNTFYPENHRHVAMMFMIGSFAWINRDAIPMNPGLLFLLLVFAASLHGTNKFGFAYAVLLPYLVFYIAVGRWGTWFNRYGDYSYGTYLYGWPAQQLTLMACPEISNINNAVFAAVLAMSLAFLSWHLVEKPSLQLKKRFSPIRA